MKMGSTPAENETRAEEVRLVKSEADKIRKLRYVDVALRRIIWAVLRLFKGPCQQLANAKMSHL
jgi:hypothetical protein